MDKNKNKFRYTFKPLFLKNNSTTLLRPVANINTEKVKIQFPILFRLHFIEKTYFPDNICMRKRGNCKWCSDEKTKKNARTFIIFPAEINNDVRLVFIQSRYLLDEYFLPQFRMFNKDIYNSWSNKLVSVEISNAKAKISIVDNTPKVVDLTPLECSIIRKKIFPYKLFAKKEVKK